MEKFNPEKLFRVYGFIAVAAIAGMTALSCSSKSPFQILRSEKIKRGDLTVTVSATGEVKPYNRVEIKPPIAGRIEEVLFKEGDEVTKGQILAWMSSTERAALLDAARSRGEDSYKEWADSYKPAPLTSPLNGMVIVRAVEPGQTVTTADPVMVISDRLIIKAMVDETDLAQIHVGQHVEIQLDAYRDQKIAGSVDHISYESQLINNVNVYDVDIVPEEIPPAYRSGMTATITFIVAERKGVLLVPSEAISAWPKDKPKVEDLDFALYKKSFGKLVPIPVKIGDSDGRMTEITRGGTEGIEIFIVRRKQSLSTSFSTQNQKRPSPRTSS